MVKKLWRRLQLNIRVNEVNEIATAPDTLTSSGYPEEPSVTFGFFFSFCFLSAVETACSKTGICAACDDDCAIYVLVILNDAGYRQGRTDVRWI